jgi:uncharacterized RDD family membrane protein YckC
MTTEEISYPRLLDRVKAVFIDAIGILLLMVAVSAIFSGIEAVSDNVRIAAFIFIFWLYDPLFTSIFGGTIGHMIVGIRVKKERNEASNISFFHALFRFVFKSMLGWISLLTVTNNKKRKAIHDSIAGSVVVYRT